MRALRVCLATGLAALAATSANAGVTVDLLWLDSGTRDLTVASGDPGANGSCAGFNNPGPFSGRCMNVVMTADQQILFGGASVAWDPGATGLTAIFATSFKKAGIPIGKSGAFLQPIAPNVDNVDGTILTFGGLNNPPGIGQGIPPGTYTLGTIVWDTQGAAHGETPLGYVLDPNFTSFWDTTNTQITNVVLNDALLTVAPEPSTGLLIAAGVCALAAFRRGRHEG